jgi:hypothetical protein
MLTPNSDCPETRGEILIDGLKLTIPSNCYAALRRLSRRWELRSLGHSSMTDKWQQLMSRRRTLLLWVDSICIDQSNLEERNSQVALMCRVYTQAESVVIWLGEEDESSTEAVRQISALSTYRGLTK